MPKFSSADAQHDRHYSSVSLLYNVKLRLSRYCSSLLLFVRLLRECFPLSVSRRSIRATPNRHGVRISADPMNTRDRLVSALTRVILALSARHFSDDPNKSVFNGYSRVVDFCQIPSRMEIRRRRTTVEELSPLIVTGHNRWLKIV